MRACRSCCQVWWADKKAKATKEMESHVAPRVRCQSESPVETHECSQPRRPAMSKQCSSELRRIRRTDGVSRQQRDCVGTNREGICDLVPSIGQCMCPFEHTSPLPPLRPRKKIFFGASLNCTDNLNTRPEPSDNVLIVRKTLPDEVACLLSDNERDKGRCIPIPHSRSSRSASKMLVRSLIGGVLRMSLEFPLPGVKMPSRINWARKSASVSRLGSGSVIGFSQATGEPRSRT